jgi:hypothetical protein
VWWGWGTAGRCAVDLLTDGTHWICDDPARPLLLPGRPRFLHRSLLLSASLSELDENELTGTVPTEIGLLTRLDDL